MNKIIKPILIAIFLLSILGNIYFFGKQWYEKKLAERFNQGVVFVFETAKKNGTVTYTTLEGEKIILILQQ